jgi:putative ABC transport system permease protein
MERVRILGVSPEYVAFGNFDAERGRMMTASEVERNRPVVLLGAQTAEGLFGDVSPLDKTISIEGIHFLVVGVSSAKGSFLGNTQDDVAVIPIGLHTKLFGARQQLTFIAKPVTPDRLQEAMDAATVALRVERRLKARERDNFGIFTSATLLGIYQQATNGIFAVLIGVVALSLLVGGIVIMNIMLMVVSERTREIGLRKALGARRADIMSQVLTESVTLSTIGGLAGIALGYLVAQGLAAVSPLPAVLEPWSVALGIGITAVVGLFFGAYPASRAAALDPIEALRRE